MFGLLSPPLCYPERLAVAQSAQGSSDGNVISIIKRAAFEKLALGLAVSLVTEQQLGCRYLSGLCTFQAISSNRKPLVHPFIRADGEARLSMGGAFFHREENRV